MLKKRLSILLIVIPALAAGMTTFPAFAQTQLPSLDVHPVGTSKTDPDGGQWFFANGIPGQTQRFQMRLYNPTNEPKNVKLYFADMTFNSDGTAVVAATSTDLGRWGRFDDPRLTVGAHKAIFEGFSVTPPKGADPGDHIGAAVVEEAPAGGGPIRSIQRVALRVYMTLPGDARKEFDIHSVSAARRSLFYPRKIDVAVELRNTGRVRLDPTVTVNGAATKGPNELLTQSRELYNITVPVHFWGGPVMLHVNAQTSTFGLPGPARQVSVLVWVIPWHLFALLALLALIVLGVRWIIRRRRARVTGLQADIRRLERLVTLQHESRQAPPPEVAAEAHDARVAIFAAAKQARRAGDLQTAKRLEQFLAETARQLNGGGPSRPSESRRTG